MGNFPRGDSEWNTTGPAHVTNDRLQELLMLPEAIRELPQRFSGVVRTSIPLRQCLDPVLSDLYP